MNRVVIRVLVSIIGAAAITAVGDVAFVLDVHLQAAPLKIAAWAGMPFVQLLLLARREWSQATEIASIAAGTVLWTTLLYLALSRLASRRQGFGPKDWVN